MATRMRRRRRGRTTDDTFHNGDVLGREVGRQWEGGRAAAMTEDETPRFSSVHHRSQGNDNDAGRRPTLR
jgi:hypothetical protein